MPDGGFEALPLSARSKPCEACDEWRLAQFLASRRAERVCQASLRRLRRHPIELGRGNGAMRSAVFESAVPSRVGPRICPRGDPRDCPRQRVVLIDGEGVPKRRKHEQTHGFIEEFPPLGQPAANPECELQNANM